MRVTCYAAGELHEFPVNVLKLRRLQIDLLAVVLLPISFSVYKWFTD